VHASQTHFAPLGTILGPQRDGARGRSHTSLSVVRNPDFIYKQVHNPDVTNPDLADVRVTHLFVSP